MCLLASIPSNLSDIAVRNACWSYALSRWYYALPSPSSTSCNQALNFFSIINRTLEAKGSCVLPWEEFISFEERLNERWTWFPGNRLARHQLSDAHGLWLQEDYGTYLDVVTLLAKGPMYFWIPAWLSLGYSRHEPIFLRALEGDILYSKAWQLTNPQQSSCPPAPRLMQTHQMERRCRPRWGVYLESEWGGGRMMELWEVGRGCR